LCPTVLVDKLRLLLGATWLSVNRCFLIGLAHGLTKNYLLEKVKLTGLTLLKMEQYLNELNS
jgi:hypothetical protein